MSVVMVSSMVNIPLSYTVDTFCSEVLLHTCGQMGILLTSNIYLNSSVFWVVTWRKMVLHRRFRTTYQLRLQGSSLTLEDETDR